MSDWQTSWVKNLILQSGGLVRSEGLGACRHECYVALLRKEEWARRTAAWAVVMSQWIIPTRVQKPAKLINIRTLTCPWVSTETRREDTSDGYRWINLGHGHDSRTVPSGSTSPPCHTWPPAGPWLRAGFSCAGIERCHCRRWCDVSISESPFRGAEDTCRHVLAQTTRYCSPSPVKLRTLAPMLSGAALYTPWKGACPIHRSLPRASPAVSQSLSGVVGSAAPPILALLCRALIGGVADPVLSSISVSVVATSSLSSRHHDAAHAFRRDGK